MALRRALACIHLLVACLLWALPSRAVDQSTLVVLAGEGDLDPIKYAIEANLPEPWQATEPAALNKALIATGAPAMPKALADKKASGTYIEKVARATSRMAADAALLVRVAPKPKKGARTAHVVIITPAGKRTFEKTVALGAESPDADAAVVLTEIAPTLARIAPPPKPPPPPPPPVAVAPRPSPATPPPPAAKPAEPITKPKPGAAAAPAVAAAPAKKAEPVPADARAGASPAAPVAAAPSSPAPAGAPAAGRRPTSIEAMAGIELGFRHIGYRELSTGNLQPYGKNFVPTPAVGLNVYPFALSGIPVLQDLGATGSFRTALGLESSLADGTKLHTVWTRVDIGGRARIRFRSGLRPPEIGLLFGYTQEVFVLTDPQNGVLDIPSVRYKALRAGVDGRVPVGPVVLMGTFAYLDVLEAGDLAERIRGANVSGFEGELGAAVPFLDVFDVRALVNYRLYSFSFDPGQNDTTAALGARDQIVRTQLALSFTY
jgi:hypothetical protein